MTRNNISLHYLMLDFHIEPEPCLTKHGLIQNKFNLFSLTSSSNKTSIGNDIL